MKTLLLAGALALASMTAHAFDSDPAPAPAPRAASTTVDTSPMAVGKRAIADKQWQAAIHAFLSVTRNEPRNADAHNYLGYSYRNLGNFERSFSHYAEALRLEPNHRGAHNYVGIAYLKSGKPEKAAEHLARLERICSRKCVEYADLKKAIDADKRTASAGAANDPLAYGY